MNSPNRVARTLVILGILSFFSSSAPAAQVDAFWNPGSANWSLAGSWTPAVIPNNGTGGNTYRVFIDNGNATNSVASLNISPIIDQLTVSAGDTLSFPNSFDLTIAQGPIVNNGTISMGSSGSATELVIAVPMSLTGTGVLLMSNNVNNFIDDADNGAGPLLTHGAGHTIRGSGALGTDAVALNNAGLIDANQSIPLTMDLLNAGPNTNTGTIQSSGSGILDISGTVLTNTGGLIQALDTSTVNVINSSIIGGTLHADSGSAISPNAGSSRFQDVTLTGLLRHDNNDDAEYVGTITNNGAIALNSTGSTTEIDIPPPSTTFAGTGEIVMSSNSQNLIDDNDAGQNPLLVNSATHTIRGAGNIGVDGLHMTNNGLIQADQTTPMTIDLTSPGPNVNNGIIQAIGTSTLDINSTPLDNTNGQIKALGTSTVNVNSSTIIGGTLHADPGSAFSPNAGSTRFENITLTGLIRHDNNEDAEYAGTITNNGTIALNSTASTTELVIPPPSTTFAGTGEIVMSSNSQNIIDDNDAGQNPLLVNGATHTIRGAGNIGSDGIHMTNFGLIQADQTTPMTIDLTSPGPNVNNGIIQAIGTSTLDINSTPLDNTNGQIKALDTSTVNVNSSTIIGGTLHADPGSAFSPNAGSTRFENITLTGLIRHDNNEDAEYAGTITNDGTIALNSTGAATEIAIPTAGTTFAGTGEIVMSSNSQNFIDDTDAGPNPTMVNGPSHTIRGAGNVGTNAVHITNNGTITADQALPMTIDSPDSGQGLLNNGTINVTGAGGMNIVTGVFTNAGSVNVGALRNLARTGPYTQTAGTTTVNGGLSVGTGGMQIQGGILKGNGIVSGALVTNSGTIAPGDGIGQLGIQNGLTLTASSTVAIEIGGTTPVTQHDVLAVTGATHLDGVLQITFVNGFDPTIGQSFVVMTYPNTPLNTLGKFINLNVPCNLMGRKIQVDINLTQVIVRIIAAADLGGIDVNCDCGYTMQIDVSALILAMLDPAAFNALYPGCTNADINGDSVVNGKDVQAFVTALLN